MTGGLLCCSIWMVGVGGRLRRVTGWQWWMARCQRWQEHYWLTGTMIRTENRRDDTSEGPDRRDDKSEGPGSRGDGPANGALPDGGNKGPGSGDECPGGRYGKCWSQFFYNSERAWWLADGLQTTKIGLAVINQCSKVGCQRLTQLSYRSGVSMGQSWRSPSILVKLQLKSMCVSLPLWNLKISKKHTIQPTATQVASGYP